MGRHQTEPYRTDPPQNQRCSKLNYRKLDSRRKRQERKNQQKTADIPEYVLELGINFQEATVQLLKENG